MRDSQSAESLLAIEVHTHECHQQGSSLCVYGDLFLIADLFVDDDKQFNLNFK